MHVFDSLSFLYRRCTQPLPSVCPAENVKINPTASAVSSTVASLSADPVAGSAVTVYLTEGLIAALGSQVTLSAGNETTSPKVVGVVFSSKSNTTKTIQVTSVSGTGTGTSGAVVAADLAGATATVG